MLDANSIERPKIELSSFDAVDAFLSTNELSDVDRERLRSVLERAERQDTSAQSDGALEGFIAIDPEGRIHIHVPILSGILDFSVSLEDIRKLLEKFFTRKVAA